MNLITKFFDAWGQITGTEYKRHNALKWFGGYKVIGVNWPIVTFVLVMWAAMVLAWLVTR